MNTNKYILLIDMDGPLCNWYGQVLSTYKARFPYRPAVEFENVTQFYAENLYPEEHRADVTAISRERGFYTRLEPIAGAIEALKDIEANCLDFIEPYICSSPEVEYEGLLCHSEKAAWVEERLGSFWTKRLILTKDKTLVRGHFLIDDKPEITGAMAPTWGHLVFDEPYNQETVGNGRFTWKDWPKLKALLLHLTNEGKRKIQMPTPTIAIARPEDVCRLHSMP